MMNALIKKLEHLAEKIINAPEYREMVLEAIEVISMKIDTEAFQRDVLEKLNGFTKQGIKIMATLADIQASNTALTAAVAVEDTVIDGAITLINGLNGQIAALTTQLAAAGTDPVALQAVVDSMKATTADLTAKTTALAAATVTNTGTPTPAPTVAPAPTPPATA
jgi:hypothetical protein